MIKSIIRKGIKIKMVVETPYELDRLRTFYTKEPETISWIENLIKPKDVFYDIGANVGVFSLFARAFHGPKVKVISLEPCYHNFNKLCLNIIANNFSEEGISPFCVAVGDKTGVGILNIISNVSGSSGHKMGELSDQLGKRFKPEFRQGIFSITLEDAVKKFGLPQPNHIKIDTDGFEEKVLKGGKDVFKNSHLKSVLIEVTDINGAGPRTERFMRNNGFGATHPINFQKNHSRYRRQIAGRGMIKNLIFTRK